MQALRNFPHLELDATVSPITRNVLRVTLRLSPHFEWKDRLHGTVERWWIWVEVSAQPALYLPRCLQLPVVDRCSIHSSCSRLVHRPFQIPILLRSRSFG